LTQHPSDQDRGVSISFNPLSHSGFNFSGSVCALQYNETAQSEPWLAIYLQ